MAFVAPLDLHGRGLAVRMRRRLAHMVFWGVSLVIIYAAALSYMVKEKDGNEA